MVLAGGPCNTQSIAMPGATLTMRLLGSEFLTLSVNCNGRYVGRRSRHIDHVGPFNPVVGAKSMVDVLATWPATAVIWSGSREPRARLTCAEAEGQQP